MAGDDIRVVGDWRGERTGTLQSDQVIDLFVNLPSSFLLTRPVLSGDQGIESLKRVAAGAKK